MVSAVSKAESESMFHLLRGIVAGKPAEAALTAAVNLVVYCAKALGVPKNVLIESVDVTWKNTHGS